MIRIPLVISLLVGSASTYVSDHYRTNDEINEILMEISLKNSHISSVYSIGSSAQGRDLMVMKLNGINVSDAAPHVKLIGSIHGNQPVGRELLLYLIQELVDGYNKGDETIVRIMDSTFIHILPTMNPDGFNAAIEGVCSKGPGRENANGFDLNKNFPSTQRRDEDVVETQPETAAVMKWMHNIPFVLSATIFGGSLVACYPYDEAKPQAGNHLGELKTDDDDVFMMLASSYAKDHGWMAKETECPDIPRASKNGTINGGSWYPTRGSMMDYNYDFHGCLELSLVLSCCQYPNPIELEQIWIDNKKPLLEFLMKAQKGIHGKISVEGKGALKATVRIQGRNDHQTTTEDGRFWRILLPGVYYLLIEVDGFIYLERVVLPNEASHVLLNLNFTKPKEPTETETNKLREISPTEDPEYELDDYVDTVLNSTTADEFATESYNRTSLNGISFSIVILLNVFYLSLILNN